ncbi:MAG: sugar kinase [Rhodospirillaceae bacterium]|jgi:sulfofructose kinase|nr:sugar kinase [Rhodospirillaceae bacterium]MBT6403814.1 sugar kinase [Rhodospirillaceae bacterium]MBT6536169.1 sugar kinase [Rhodospirillaceae bacterium]MBT7362552.1 sugar kinase [Rhodospirillaceae bacterium]
MAEVTCVGIALLDHVFEGDFELTGGDLAFAQDFNQYGGGTAATASVAVVRLGGFSTFWGRLGDDETGLQILDGLKRHGVQTEHVRLVAGAQSPVTSILTSANGERHETIFAGRDLDADASWLPFGRIEDTSAILVDPRWPEAAMPALQNAYDHRVPAILDGEAGPDPVPRELIEMASHVVFSHAGLLQYSGTPDVRTALEAVAATTEARVGVTAGWDGFSWLNEDGHMQSVAALDLPVIDKLGARDVFLGAFALAIGEEKDLDLAARFANAAAGLKSSKPGGRGAIPCRAEIWELLDDVEPD